MNSHRESLWRMKCTQGPLCSTAPLTHTSMKMRLTCGKHFRPWQSPIKSHISEAMQHYWEHEWKEVFFPPSEARSNNDNIWNQFCLLSGFNIKSVVYQWFYICIQIGICVFLEYIIVCHSIHVYIWMCLVCFSVRPVVVWVYMSATVRQSVFHGLVWTQSKVPSCFRSTLNHGSPHRCLILIRTGSIWPPRCVRAQSYLRCLLEPLPHSFTFTDREILYVVRAVPRGRWWVKDITKCIISIMY